MCSKCGILSLFLRRNGAFLYVFDQKSGGLLHLPHPTTLPPYAFIYKCLPQKGSGVYLIKKFFLVDVVYMRPTGMYIFAYTYRRISPHIYTWFPISFSAFPASVQHKSVKGFDRNCQGFSRKVPKVLTKSAKRLEQKCQRTTDSRLSPRPP